MFQLNIDGRRTSSPPNGSASFSVLAARDLMTSSAMNYVLWLMTARCGQFQLPGAGAAMKKGTVSKEQRSAKRRRPKPGDLVLFKYFQDEPGDYVLIVSINEDKPSPTANILWKDKLIEEVDFVFLQRLEPGVKDG
jgi:hypothetical protein